MIHAKTNANYHISKWIQGLDWNWYITLTTRYHLTNNSAHRLTNRYVQNIVKTFTRPKVDFFYVIEKYKTPLVKDHTKMEINTPNNKTGTHIHGLMLLNCEENNNCNLQLIQKELISLYQATAGGDSLHNEGRRYIFHRNRITPYRVFDSNKVSDYCTKYILKGDDISWNYIKSDSPMQNWNDEAYTKHGSLFCPSDYQIYKNEN